MPYYPDIAKRIKQIAQALKTDQAGLGRLAGVSKTAAGNWFAGRACPQREALIKLKRNARVNDEWLITGKGDMFLPSAAGSRDTSHRVDAETERMLVAWERLPQAARHHYIALMEMATAEEGAKPKKNEVSE